MNLIHKNIFAFLIAAVAFLSARADFIEDFTSSPAIDAEKSAVMVVDLSDGRTMASHNVEGSLIPASIMKAATIAALIEKIGIDYTYDTEVFTDGKISDGELRGNLIIKGSGDPSLNSAKIESADICREIAEALRKAGVRRILGRVIVDESDFEGPATPPSWASGDLPHYYGTGSHALNFEDNSVGKSAVKDPSDVFRRRLLLRLAKEGITIENEDIGESHRHKLMTHQSVPVDEIMRSCMMRSDNLYAESMLRTVARANGRKGSTQQGAEIETDYWKRKKMPMEGVIIYDGSGLSRSDRVTAQFMAAVLEKMAENVDYASFFPLAGQEGTLRNFLRDTPLDSYIALKTGSMNGIQCYAGYKLDDDYAPTHAVVVILNSLPKGRAAARKEVEKLLLRLFVGDTSTLADPEPEDNDE